MSQRNYIREKQANHCDGGHDTTGMIRKMPLGGGANLLVCHKCYKKEIDFRDERNLELPMDNHFDLPQWEILEIVEQGD